jgi:serine/threonine-protein kinase
MALVVLLGIDLALEGGLYEILVTTPITTPTATLAASTILMPTPTETLMPTSVLTSIETLTLAITLAPTLASGATQVSEVDGMVMVYVPAGEFEMGSETGGSEESPVHTVSLDAFWIDRTEVTNAIFEIFVNQTGHQTDAEKAGWSYVFNGSERVHTNAANWEHPEGPGSGIAGKAAYPVIHVSWNDAQAYCEWAGRHLPSEAEWEKAARGTDGRAYPWGNTFSGARLNFCDSNCSFDWKDNSSNDGYADTAPVGSFLTGASPYGALDMAGNVGEWVADWFDSGYYASSPSSNPAGPTSGQYRVLRGGSWLYGEGGVRSALRAVNYPDVTGYPIGFRCSLSSP